MTLSPTDTYLFDTLGFVVLRGVLSAEDLGRLNVGIARRRDFDFHERTNAVRNSASGSSGRIDCGNFLTWPAADGGDDFRSLLCHPRIRPVLDQLCGVGHRLDHKPVLFLQPPGAEGFDLHGGAVAADGRLNFPVAYHCHGSQIVCSLINVAVQLTASPAGAGGFVVIPGSHKSNFPVPKNQTELEIIATEYGYQPVCEAGDVALFTEAVLHGAAVRTADTERRVALIRFAPATCAYARGYLECEDFYHCLTPAQQAVAAPPYHLDQDRAVPTDDAIGAHIPRPRKPEKKEFDRVVFGHDYY